MKIYVATKFEYKEAARAAMQTLRDAGHSITYDWTAAEGSQSTIAFAEVDAVATSDVVMVLTIESVSLKGAWFEAGVAYGLRYAGYRNQVIIVSPDRQTIFEELDGIYRVTTMREALDMLFVIGLVKGTR